MTTKEKLQKKLKILSAKEHYDNTLMQRAFNYLKNATTFSQQELPTKPVDPMLI